MRVGICLVLIATTMLASCVSGDKKAAELLDTAGFEEKQHNFDHASQLYAEIMKKHPDSPAAQEAAARLAVLKGSKP